jgi:hypothetical protein
MLTDAEWREAYDYLLSKLHEIKSDGSLVLGMIIDEVMAPDST